MKKIAMFAAAAMLAAGALMFGGQSASAAPAGTVAGQVEATASSDLQSVYYHNRWRSHHRWGSGGGFYHNRWRSHHRWGSRGGWHNRWRSHHRWGSRW